MKSGGPIMLVSLVMYGTSVSCHWFVDDKLVNGAFFPLELKPVEAGYTTRTPANTTRADLVLLH